MYKILKSLDTVFALWDKIKMQRRSRMVRATDESVADDVTKYLEDNPSEMGSDGQPPKIVILTYENSTQGYVGAVIVLSIIFTLSLFLAMAVFKAGEMLTPQWSVTN